MTTVLFIHSAGAQGPGQGSSALRDALEGGLPQGMDFKAPFMPEPDDPKAELWLAAFESAVNGVEHDLVIVGHSLGGSIALKGLTRLGVPVNLKGVVTVAAPFWGAPDWDFDSFALPNDAAEKLSALSRLRIVQGDGDEVVPVDHAERYKALLPSAQIAVLPGVDHAAAGAASAVIEAVAAFADSQV